MEIAKFLQDNWNALSAAPWAFLILVILAFGLAYFVARWHYEGRVELLKDRVDGLNERLAAKDELLADYRERLQLVPGAGSAYARMSNKEIRSRTLDLVERIRKFVHGAEELEMEVTLHRQSLRASTPREDQSESQDAETRALIQRSLKTVGDYDANFKVESILLRDELLARLPSELKDKVARIMYEHPTNWHGMRAVADHLQRLAMSLPVPGEGTGV